MLYLIFATLIVVVLFQVIILINQRKNGKLVGDFIAQKNSRNFQSDRGGDRPDRFRDRNNNGNRPNRPPRTEQESRPRPPIAPAAPAATDGAVDNMEKSLRDINLKLKNAEHDQEVARRKFQDNGTGSGNRDENRGSRDGGSRGGRDGGRGGRDGNRGGRDGGRGRDENRGGRDENRDQRRGGGDRDRSRNNWRDRNQDRPFQEEQSAESGDVEVQATALPIIDTGAISAPVTIAAAPELNASDFNSDNTEHGRKIQVKRRMLGNDQPGEETPSDLSNASSDTMSEASSEQPSSDAGISFGRR